MNYHDYDETLPKSGTWFATAERSTAEELQYLVDYCKQDPTVQAILLSVDGYVLILNEQRQVVAANEALLHDLHASSTDKLIGLRPGEVFGCVHSCDAPGGCGTSKSCSVCGAVISVLSSQILNQPATGDCLMSVQRNGIFEAHEFSIRTTPLPARNTKFIVFVAHDISAVKRSDALENILFHDFKNIVTGIRGWSELLVKRPQDAASIARKLVNLSTRLAQEVESHNVLLQAERGKLQITLENALVAEVMDDLRDYFSSYPSDKIHSIVIHYPEEPVTVRTNRALLTQVLAHMVKNALEAVQPSEQVQLRFEDHELGVCFIVHNPGEIPEAVALQIFKRSFSTKSLHGRGLGTYCMKLLGEQYLGGAIGFSTDEENGTSFYIILPRMSEQSS